MSDRQWPKYILNQTITITVGAGIGIVLGHIWLGFIAALVFILAYQTLQLARLEQWITVNSQNPPPDLRGYLSLFSDRIYYFQRREKKAQSTLKSLLKRAQASANALSDAYLTLDKSDQLEWWNKAANKLLGLQYPRDIGQPIIQLLRDPDFIEYFQHASQNQGKRAPRLKIASPISPNTHIEIQLTHYGDNEKLIHVRNITQLIHLEQVRTDFIANMSHELRTPMTVMAGYVELFEDFAEELPEPLAPSVSTMKSQVKRMQNLVEDLFTLTRFEDPSVSFKHEQIDLQLLLKEIVDEAKILAREKDIKLYLPELVSFDIKGDRGQIRSALSNLINNAVHYTNLSGTVTITTELSSDGGTIGITDTGIGIEKAHIPRLTERFYRVDPSRSTATGGTGLGLAIVKHALLRHNATLTIDSVEGKGSCFSCHFPSKRIVSKHYAEALS